MSSTITVPARVTIDLTDPVGVTPRPPADPNDPNRVNLDLTPYPPFVPPVLPPTLPALQPGVQAAKGDQLYADRVNQLRSEGFTDAQLVALGVELP